MIGRVVMTLAVEQSEGLRDTLGQQLSGDESLLDCGVDLGEVHARFGSMLPVLRVHEFERACAIAFTTGLELGIRAARIEAAPLPDRRIVL